jgi:uncharacterized protein YecE (DUF72 family)
MIKIGTCGFQFKDWKGTVYPKNIKDSEILTYYNKSLGFDLVEIDASYYQIFNPRVSESWVKKTTGDFRFAVKCHRDLTLNESGKVNPKEIDNNDIFKHFLSSFQPMIESGKLLTFLAQFGPVFFRNKENKDYIRKFRSHFKDLPLTIEFRHKSWLVPEQHKDTFDFLRENNLGYAVVDEPKIRNLAPLVPEATDDLAYIRLHGRNKQWFEADGEKRYDYYYSDEELSEFIPFIKALDKKTSITTVFFNNCHAGAALKNAVKLKQLLGIAEYVTKKEEQPGEQLGLPFDEN